MSELIKSLRNAKYDKLKILDKATAQEAQDYIRKNSQYSHDVIIVSSR